MRRAVLSAGLAAAYRDCTAPGPEKGLALVQLRTGTERHVPVPTVQQLLEDSGGEKAVASIKTTSEELVKILSSVHSAWDHLQQLNELRATGFDCPGRTFPPNAEPLKLDCRLFSVATLHSQDMAQQEYADHVSKGDGSDPASRARPHNVEVSAENIAQGPSTSAGALEEWKRNGRACHAMMNPNFATFGAGYGFKDLYDSDDPLKDKIHFWTQLFGNFDTVDDSCYPPEARSTDPVDQIRDGRLHLAREPKAFIVMEPWISPKAAFELYGKHKK